MYCGPYLQAQSIGDLQETRHVAATVKSEAAFFFFMVNPKHVHINLNVARGREIRSAIAVWRRRSTALVGLLLDSLCFFLSLFLLTLSKCRLYLVQASTPHAEKLLLPFRCRNARQVHLPSNRDPWRRSEEYEERGNLRELEGRAMLFLELETAQA